MYFNDDDFKRAIWTLIAIGAAAGIVLALVFPWLWEIVKPLLHSSTA